MPELNIADARKKYTSHKSRAKIRGIGFDLTFEQWLYVWGDKLNQRGHRSDQLVMRRHKDEGPYAIGNVSIGTPMQNRRDRKDCAVGQDDPVLTGAANVRRSEMLLLARGGKRIPGGYLQPEAADALEYLVSIGYGKGIVSVISNAILEAHKTLPKT